MPSKSEAEKSPGRRGHGTRSVATGGPQGISLAPPPCGIDFVDRARAGDGPLQLAAVTDVHRGAARGSATAG